MFFLKFPKNFQNSYVKEQRIFVQRVPSKKRMDYSKVNKKRFKFSNT